MKENNVRLQDIVAKTSRVSLTQTIRVFRALIVCLRGSNDQELRSAADLLAKLLVTGESEMDVPTQEQKEAADLLYKRLHRDMGGVMMRKLRTNDRDLQVFTKREERYR